MKNILQLLLIGAVIGIILGGISVYLIMQSGNKKSATEVSDITKQRDSLYAVLKEAKKTDSDKDAYIRDLEEQAAFYHADTNRIRIKYVTITNDILLLPATDQVGLLSRFLASAFRN